MVDYSSLENYRTERYRGFESLSLRKEFSTPLDSFFPFESQPLGSCQSVVGKLRHSSSVFIPTLGTYFSHAGNIAFTPWEYIDITNDCSNGIVIIGM